MDTIRQSLGLRAFLHTANALSNRLISQQHELLDEFIGILRGLKVGAYGFTCLIDIEMQFLAVELHRTVLESGCTEFLSQGIEFDELVGILALIGFLLRGRRCRLARAVFHTIILQDLLNLFIGIAAVALDDGMCQMPGLDVGLVVHLEDNTVTELFFVWAE